MKAVLANTLDGIDKDVWNSLVESNDGALSYDYLMAIEKSIICDYRYFYVLVHDSEDTLISVVPIFITKDFSLEGSVTNLYIKSICASIRRIFAKFMKERILFVGNCLSRGQIKTRDGYDSEAVLELILRKIDFLAEAEKIKLIVFKDFSENADSMSEFMRSKSYYKVYNFPGTCINLEVNSFDDYLSKMKSKRRQNIRYKIRRNEEDANIAYHVVDDYIGILDELYALYEKTYKKALVKFEKLNKDFFINLKKNLGDNVKVITAVLNGQIIGFALFICSGSYCTNLRVGLDYNHSNKYFVYYMLHYKNIEFAIQNGYHKLYLGQTSYSAKLEMGAELIPSVLYVRYRSNFLRNYMFYKMYDMTLRRYGGFPMTDG